MRARCLIAASPCLPTSPAKPRVKNSHSSSPLPTRVMFANPELSPREACPRTWGGCLQCHIRAATAAICFVLALSAPASFCSMSLRLIQSGADGILDTAKIDGSARPNDRFRLLEELAELCSS